MILCYHSVSDEWDHQLAVTEAAFEREIRSLLRRGYRSASAADAMRGGGRTFHVTFDDAYDDIGPALDLLQWLGIPATVFATTKFADGGLPLAVPELTEEVRDRPERLATMDWSRLRELVERGFEVGSHTVTHPHLPRLCDDELDAELLGSRLRCEEELGVPCRYLAYPFGEHDDRVREAARRAGYEAAFALHASSIGTDPFAVPRVDLYRGEPRLESRIKMSPLRRPAYALARMRSRWPAPASYGHGWMVATIPAGARRFRVDDPSAAARLLASGVALVDDDADVEIGMPPTLSGKAPLAISVLAAPPHDADTLAIRVGRRLWNSVRIAALSRRARAALRKLGYPDVEVIRWDVAQTFGEPGGTAPARRRLVERFPQRALVIGRRGARAPTMLDAVREQAGSSGAPGFAGVAPNLRSGGVLILMTDDAVLRTALGPAAEQIERQLGVLAALRAEDPGPAVASRIAWPLESGRAGMALWSTERRLAGGHPDAVGPELIHECVEFLAALHELGGHDPGPTLAECAAVVAPYRPRDVGQRLQSLAERVDRAVAHLPRGFAHGDFFAGNLMVRDGSLTGVIDWDGGEPNALPLLDLLHLRHARDHSVPDDDWGRSVVEHLLPWSRRPADAVTARYCELVGVEPDTSTLEALALAYWLDRLAYQIRTHRFRRSQQGWLARNVDEVLDAVMRAEPLLPPRREHVGGAA